VSTVTDRISGAAARGSRSAARRACIVGALIVLGVVAGVAPASARMRACSMVELSHVSEYNMLACLNTDNQIYCDEDTGAARCCGRSGNSLACGEIISTRVNQPPGTRPPRVKVDIPRIDSVSPPKISRPPRIDVPPGSIGPSRPPAGPAVK
jgi:hypothetical protein